MDGRTAIRSASKAKPRDGFLIAAELVLLVTVWELVNFLGHKDSGSAKTTLAIGLGLVVVLFVASSFTKKLRKTA